MKVHNLLVTGSLTSGGENITAISSSVSSTVTSLSSSVSTSIGSLSSSMVVMITDMSSSLTSSIGSMSSSMSGRFDTIESTTGSLNSFTSSANNRLNSIEGITGSYATTGSNIFKGDQTISGSIIPAVDNTYDLGSLTHQFRDLYLSSASLYIDGTKVLSSTTQELQITTDAGQSIKILEAGSDTITLQSHDGNVTIAASGGGDVILDPTNGIIALKGTTTLYAGNRILSSDGNAIQIGNSVTMTGSLVVTGFIETQELRTTYISSSILFRSGSTKFGDELTDTHAFSGSVSISGSISVPGSNLVSGSSQITYSGLSSIPSGIISGSSQLPSGLVSGSSQITYGSISSIPSGIVSGSAQVISLLPGGTVSGSVQVDVMSTTNIARLATTGSNNFTANIGIRTAPNSGTISLTVAGETLVQGDSTNSYATFLLKDVSVGGSQWGLFSGFPALGDFTIRESGVANHLVIKKTTGDATFTGTGTFSGGGNTLTLKKGTGSPAIAFAGTSDQSTGLIEGVSGGGVRIYTSTGTLSSPSWSQKLLITPTEGVKFGPNAVSIIGTEGSHGYHYLYSAGNPKIYIEANGVVALLNPGGVAIGKSSASSALDVQAAGAAGIVLSADSNDANNSGRIFLMRTGGEGWSIMNNANNLSFRSNAIPGNTSGSERMRLDSSYNLILNNGLSVAGSTNQTGALRMNNGTGGSSPRITFGTEDESVPGNKSIYLDTYWMILQPHVNEGLRVRFVNGSGTQTETVRFQSTQATFYTNLLPGADASYNLGSTSLRWNNLYTTDLHLSNEGKQNVVDGTWGDWTLQEGENDIFMLNNRSGEKFKIKLEKIIQ